MQTRMMWRCSLVLLAILSGSVVFAESFRNAPNSKVALLIERLGSSQFAIRRSAEGELVRLGISALDELLVAQFDENPEIRLSVRELLSRLPIRFSTADEPEIVRDVAGRYGQLSRGDKFSHAYWLVQLEDGIGLPALARIVRYETSELIAKQAALALLEELDQLDPPQVEGFLGVYESMLAKAKRTPALWLARFARDLDESVRGVPEDIPDWQTFAEAEAELSGTPRSDPFIAAVLCKKWIESEIAQGNREALTKATQQLVELRKNSPVLLVETGVWLLEREQFELFEKLVWEPFPQFQNKDPLFAYCNYMSKSKQGQKDKAQEAADAAFAITESDDLFGENYFRAYTRSRVAVRLESEGFAEAAIREYRRLIEMDPNYQIARFQYQAVSSLAELLHDRQRELEAAEVLAKISVPGEDSLVEEFEEDSANVSRMYYFHSEHHRLRGERDKQIEFLNKAVEAYPQDADVLIAMHRLPRASERWRKRTSQLIADAVKSFEDRLKGFRVAGEFENKSAVGITLNQLAWLVSNTEGDFDKAIRQSRRSLELRPGRGESLDTLGRAYFAVGDFERAIRYQRRAVRKLPHSQQIVRQLEEFEAQAAGESN